MTANVIHDESTTLMGMSLPFPVFGIDSLKPHGDLGPKLIINPCPRLNLEYLYNFLKEFSPLTVISDGSHAYLGDRTSISDCEVYISIHTFSRQLHYLHFLLDLAEYLFGI
jgi:hypothetical protein